MVNITYPWAYIKPYTSVHISQAARDVPHYCFGCHRAMVLKQGAERSWHFAHKPRLEECDGDNTLHELAKEIICRGFLNATDAGTEYFAGFSCSNCQAPLLWDIAGTSIGSECTVVPGTRSDLVVMRDDCETPRLIIEIVVSHDVSAMTRERYESAGYPVIKVAPSWETLDELSTRILGYQTLNIGRRLCEACQRLRDVARRAVAEAKAKAQRAAAAAEQAVSGIKPRKETAPSVAPIKQDRWGSFLRANTRCQIMAFARKLVWLGFRQLPPNEEKRCSPTLFVFKAVGWDVYVSLDSTSVMRIWEVDCVPALFAFPRTGASGCRECLLEAAGNRLDQYGVPYRRHFEDMEGHDHET